MTDGSAALGPIVVVGLMGAGKSAVGRRLAARLGIGFVDADTEIEQAAGQTIPEIFAEHGEAYFRDGERRVMARLIESGPGVIAAGGGAFCNDETRALIKRRALSIWLRADLDTLVHRTAGRTHRPLLNQGDPRATLDRMMTERYPLYAEADVTVDTTDEPADVTARKVHDALRAHCSSLPESPR